MYNIKRYTTKTFGNTNTMRRLCVTVYEFMQILEKRANIIVFLPTSFFIFRTRFFPLLTSPLRFSIIAILCWYPSEIYPFCTLTAATRHCFWKAAGWCIFRVKSCVKKERSRTRMQQSSMIDKWIAAVISWVAQIARVWATILFSVWRKSLI